MVPWIVSRADLDTAGIGCCTTWPDIVAEAAVGAAVELGRTGAWVAETELPLALAPTFVFALPPLALTDLRAEGLVAVADGAASSFAGALDRPEEVWAEGVAEFSDETEAG